MLAAYAALYERAKRAGASKAHSGQGLWVDLEGTSFRMAPAEQALAQFRMYAMTKRGLTHAEATAEIADYVRNELTDQITLFEQGAQDRLRQRKEERENEQLEKLGLDVSAINFYRLPSRLRGKDAWLYHATSSVLLPSIMTYGLLPEPPKRSHRFGPGATKQPCVYLHISGYGGEVDGYRSQAVLVHGGEPVILRVLVSTNDVDPDPDDADLSSGSRQVIYCGVIPPSDIMQIDDQWTDAARALLRQKRKR